MVSSRVFDPIDRPADDTIHPPLKSKSIHTSISRTSKARVIKFSPGEFSSGTITSVPIFAITIIMFTEGGDWLATAYGKPGIQGKVMEIDLVW